jgi:hypothetical protein
MKEKGEEMRRPTFQAIVFVALVLVVGAGAAGSGLASSGTDSMSSIPNGTYRMTFTNDQLRGPGVGPQQRSGSVGVDTLTITSGKWKVVEKSPTLGASGVLTGTYSGSGQRVGFLHKTPPNVAGVTLQFVWSFDGKALQFKAAPGSGFPAPVVKVLWTRHPWMKTDQAQSA